MSFISTFTAALRSGKIREDIESHFGRWGLISHDHAKIIIASISIVIVALATQLPKIELETSTEAFLHEDDPARVAYNKFRYQYGRDDKILLLIETPDGVFNLKHLSQLKALHEALEKNVSRIEEVESLINARSTRGVDDVLVVGDFLEQWPETEAQVAQLKQQALANPLYTDVFISADARYTAIMLQTEVFTEATSVDMADILDDGFDEDSSETSEAVQRQPFFISGEENALIVSEVVALTESFQQEDFKIHLLGPPYMSKLVMDTMRVDMAKYTGTSILIISILLALLYRRWSMTILPLAVSLLAMQCTMAVMAMMGMKLSNSIQIMPSFLIAVGVGNSVHLFTVFYQSLDGGASKRDALAYALKHAGLAIVMTSLTTGGGLISFTISEVKVIADFGAITPIGVMVTLFFSIMFLPALIAICPLRPKVKIERTPLAEDKNRVRDFVVPFGAYSSKHPFKVTGMWLLFLSVGLFYAIQVKFSHNPVEWFAHDHPFYQAIQKVDQHFGGGTSLEVLIDSGRVDGFKDPEMLKKLDAIHFFMSEFTFQLPNKVVTINKTTSLVDINKELHQALNKNDPAFFLIPDDKELVAQELLLFENSGADDLENLVDSRFQIARLTLKKPSVDSVYYPAMEGQLRAGMEKILQGSATVEFTGVFAMMGRVLHNLTYSMANSYVLAFLLITPLMILLIGSFKMGLISMIPNLVPIVMTIGLMTLLDMPMDISTLLVGSVALGLAVDDTIHFMHNYQRFYARHGDNALAIRQTLSTTGQAVFFTSLSLICAFLAYTLSSMTNLINFGLLTSFCIGIAFLADITLSPALVTLANRKK
jgi:predicted RND superfamily exporter protein